MKQSISWLNWKRVLVLFLALLFLFLCIFLGYSYVQIKKSKIVNGDKTEEFVLKETNINKINEISQFQGEEAFHILLGTDENGKQSYIFVPIDKSLSKENTIIIPTEKLISNKQIEKQWKSECDSCTLISSTPAMINKKPLWELTYTDRSNRYVIEYISLEDGTVYEQLRLYRKYSEKG